MAAANTINTNIQKKQEKHTYNYERKKNTTNYKLLHHLHYMMFINKFFDLIVVTHNVNTRPGYLMIHFATKWNVTM